MSGKCWEMMNEAAIQKRLSDPSQTLRCSPSIISIQSLLKIRAISTGC